MLISEMSIKSKNIQDAQFVLEGGGEVEIKMLVMLK